MVHSVFSCLCSRGKSLPSKVLNFLTKNLKNLPVSSVIKSAEGNRSVILRRSIPVLPLFTPEFVSHSEEAQLVDELEAFDWLGGTGQSIVVAKSSGAKSTSLINMDGTIAKRYSIFRKLLWRTQDPGQQPSTQTGQLLNNFVPNGVYIWPGGLPMSLGASCSSMVSVTDGFIVCTQRTAWTRCDCKPSSRRVTDRSEPARPS